MGDYQVFSDRRSRDYNSNLSMVFWTCMNRGELTQQERHIMDCICKLSSKALVNLDRTPPTLLTPWISNYPEMDSVPEEDLSNSNPNGTFSTRRQSSAKLRRSRSRSPQTMPQAMI